MEAKVLIDKSEYDQLIKFRNDIEDNKVLVIHTEDLGYTKSRHLYEYIGSDKVISEIEAREKYCNKQELNEYAIEMDKLKSKNEEILKELAQLDEDYQNLKRRKRFFGLF
jgi:hypothetical protein